MADPTTISIDEAIEILQDYPKPTGFIPHENFNDAIKLGIEALKRFKEHREIGRLINPCELPGETPVESKPPRTGHPITRLPIRKGK